jgi:hypothetical protein
MKKVNLSGNEARHFRGWNPNGIATEFVISEAVIPQFGAITRFKSVTVIDYLGATPENYFCDVVRIKPSAQIFTIGCSSGPQEVYEMHYVNENLPPEIP